MGDKGGKKNKEKSQRQSGEKQKKKEKDKSDKQPKSKLSGALSSADGISRSPGRDPADSGTGSKIRIAVHQGQSESSHLLILPASWRIEELSAHFLRPPH